MSRSPVSETNFAEALAESSAYRKSLNHLNNILRHGGSLSGHEANCAFLNLQGGSFATVSAVAGFDFLDDARGLAVTDWDADGDLDIWSTNRTAPRTRFLRNETTTANHFASFRLRATRCNRDAIGSRVMVRMADERLVKSLRAGEGYLSQNTKSLHFGLGPDRQRLDEVTVHWPDGSRQTFRNLPVDRHYELIQDDPAPHVWQRPAASLAIRPGAIPQPPATQRARITLRNRMPMPPLSFTTLRDRSPRKLDDLTGPVLLTLWASWCQPCIDELDRLSQRHQELERAGLNICAVTVEGTGAATDRSSDSDAVESSSLEAAQRLAAQLNLEFTVGALDRRNLERIERAHQLPFGQAVDLPIPFSVLLDAQQRLAVIYRGPLDVDQVLHDARTLQASSSRTTRDSLRETGRWNREPDPLVTTSLVKLLVDQGELHQAVCYAERLAKQQSHHPEFPKLRVWLGEQLEADGDADAAVQQYEAALQIDSHNVAALNNLAWLRATTSSPSTQNVEQAIALAKKATRLTKGNNANVLDTLAVSFAAARQFATAVRVGQRAEQLARKNGQTQLASRIAARLKTWRRAPSPPP